jgi:hypothetical protein
MRNEPPNPEMRPMHDADLDEVDLALLDLYDYGDDCGVTAMQMHRLLIERLTLAYLIASEFDDALAEVHTIH